MTEIESKFDLSSQSIDVLRKLAKRVSSEQDKIINNLILNDEQGEIEFGAISDLLLGRSDRSNHKIKDPYHLDLIRDYKTLGSLSEVLFEEIFMKLNPNKTLLIA